MLNILLYFEIVKDKGDLLVKQLFSSIRKNKINEIRLLIQVIAFNEATLLNCFQPFPQNIGIYAI